jgi:micrococcal nuclease
VKHTLLIAVVGLAFHASSASAQGPKVAIPTCKVARIIDGDTFECSLRGKRESIRLLGIDAPEMSQRPFGERAKSALARLMPVRGAVVLDLDVRERDRYGRVLAYVWNDSASMVNEELLREGFALVDIQSPNVKYAEELRAAAQSARERNAGLWATTGFECSPSDFRRKKCK